MKIALDFPCFVVLSGEGGMKNILLCFPSIIDKVFQFKSTCWLANIVALWAITRMSSVRMAKLPKTQQFKHFSFEVYLSLKFY